MSNRPLKKIAPRLFDDQTKPIVQPVSPPAPARVPTAPVLRARCGVCRTERSWPEAMPGTAKRFFCMTCERNTIHQKFTET